MYLSDLCIRNVGPISACDIQPALNANGTPKPVTLVGLNGAGKTFLLSSIADALMLMASSAFSDVVETQGNQRPFFRLCGSTNQRSGAPYALTLLKFKDDNKSVQYIERTGKLDQQVEEELKPRFPALAGQTTSKDPFHKKTSGFSKDDIERLFLQNAYCFFPASRHEPAHWQNLEAFPDTDVFDVRPRFHGRLGKEIVTSTTGIENRRWIIDVVLDSRVDVRVNNNELQIVQDGAILQNHLLFGQARQNIELVLQKVLQEPNARINVAYRGQGSRLQIDLGNGIVIPSLSHLSLGQSILLNLFCTIVRYADAGDLNKGHQLGEIKGIAIIDEAEEVHLHETLRYEVLPELISLFPKVQFIIGTHSPSLLLGLNARLGEDQFATFDLPSGLQISIDRFSEFESSIRHLQDSAAFDASVLKRFAADGHKPIVLTEGDTDPHYIKCALEVLDRNDLISSVEIDWVGAIDAGGNPYNTGASALNATAKLFEANPTLLNRGLSTGQKRQHLPELICL